VLIVDNRQPQFLYNIKLDDGGDKQNVLVSTCQLFKLWLEILWAPPHCCQKHKSVIITSVRPNKDWN
jgi:hypothetical protein